MRTAFLLPRWALLAFVPALVLACFAGPVAEPVAAQPSLVPQVGFDVRVMQGAQFIRTDEGALVNEEAAAGFQRVRYNLEVTARFGERVVAFADLGHEPNDFGTGGNSFSPAIDYVALDLLLSETFILRLGTPVTGLFQFRGYSDGAATQGNPLIGNSPADFVTAESGLQLIGSAGSLSYDLTATSPTFFETFTPGTGLTLVARGRFDATETAGVGVAIAQGTNGGTVDRFFDGELSFGQVDAINMIVGDGENYHLPAFGQPTRATHAYLLPGITATLLQAELGLSSERFAADVWGGYGVESYSFANAQGQPVPARLGISFVEEDSQMLWAGATLKVDLNEQFYLAGRGTFVQNASDWADDDTNLLRLQLGAGYGFWDVALFKLEYVMQTEEANSPGQVGVDWQGVSAELSVGI